MSRRADDFTRHERLPVPTADKQAAQSLQMCIVFLLFLDKKRVYKLCFFIKKIQRLLSLKTPKKLRLYKIIEGDSKQRNKMVECVRLFIHC